MIDGANCSWCSHRQYLSVYEMREMIGGLWCSHEDTCLLLVFEHMMFASRGRGLVLYFSMLVPVDGVLYIRLPG